VCPPRRTVPDFLVSIGLKYVEMISTPSVVDLSLSPERENQGLNASKIVTCSLCEENGRTILDADELAEAYAHSKLADTIKVAIFLSRPTVTSHLLRLGS
jgi:hypothetical protein